jgi:LysM repeat protein
MWQEPLNLAQPCPVGDPEGQESPIMSRCSGRHAKIPSRYEGRHIRPGAPGPGVVVGTAAKALPASLVVGAAGSALVLSGTASAASAATTAPGGPVRGGAADLAAAKIAFGTWVTRGRHAAARSTYTVVSGDTLSAISARFCGTPADYPSLAAASSIANPNLIFTGQTIKLRCHAKPAAAAPPPGSGNGNADDDAATAPSNSASPSSSASDPAPAPQSQPQSVGTGGLSAFESCVISHESGGNPEAVNPSSGAGGLFQFLPSTWASLGFAGSYPGGAQTAPVSVQEAAFNKLYAEAGTSPWAPYDGC